MECGIFEKEEMSGAVLIKTVTIISHKNKSRKFTFIQQKRDTCVQIVNIILAKVIFIYFI